MHASIPTLALALGAALALTACQRPIEVVATPATVVVSGPAGPAGEAGAQGKPGAAGPTSADATVIVVQPTASAPGN